ncbi:Uncharacterized protein FWK35_00026298, partial [Aphis craccivora]
MNLVGTLRRSFFEFPNSFQKRREKPKKSNRKTGIFTQNQFSTKSIFYMVVIQKLITVKTCNFHQIFMSVIDKKILDDLKFKFLRNLSKTRKFA